jgi:hypothetical protein
MNNTIKFILIFCFCTIYIKVWVFQIFKDKEPKNSEVMIIILMAIALTKMN